MHESLNDALIEVIREAGGSKTVGLMLRPELSASDAGVWLRNCLSDDRREKLSLDQFLFLLKVGRERDCHAAIEFLATDTGYAATPIEPEEELARVMRAVQLHNERKTAAEEILAAQLAKATATLKSAQARRKVRT